MIHAACAVVVTCVDIKVDLGFGVAASAWCGVQLLMLCVQSCLNLAWPLPVLSTRLLFSARCETNP